MNLELRYFAWIRERVGAAAETVETRAATVAELVEELRRREERYALAFADLRSVRVAVDQELASFEAPIGDAREVAFFPPMTGG
jgi:sulfur-carrier protein